MARAILLQRDLRAEQVFAAAGIDLVFQHSTWYGARFRFPTLTWIYDFQHRHMPHMFTKKTYWKREIGFRALAQYSTRIMVSSEDARHDCETFYPAARGRILVNHFAVKLGPTSSTQELLQIRELYRLPEKFFYLPNQFWKHKNHLLVLEALRLLKQRGVSIVVVVSGNPQDCRDPAHPQRIVNTVREYGLENEFRILGLIPYPHVGFLMRLSAAVINPSLFEGWSTTVEEAKAYGVPLVLSNIGVHQEQAPDTCKFFDPTKAEELAKVLSLAWEEWSPGPRPRAETTAAEANRLRRIAFAQRFVAIAQETISSKR
jgi:glycosyltransferase involved in cell wall biosynthesis